MSDKRRKALLDILMKVPGLDDEAGRGMLLDGIPVHLRANVPSHPAKFTHLHTILEYAEGWEYIEGNPKHVLVIIAENALSFLKGTARGKEIEKWIEKFNGEEKQGAATSSKPVAHSASGGQGSSVNSGYSDEEEEEKENHLLELRNRLKRRLNSLQMQRATMGIRTPPDINIEIEDTEKEIAEIESKLKEMGRL